MPTFDITTERRVLITAADEAYARAIAMQTLGLSDFREGYSQAGAFSMKTFPGAITSCVFAQTKMER